MTRAMKLVALLAMSIVVIGCQSREPQKIGRYQIVNDTKNDGVFWVDTVTGQTEQCLWAAEQSHWSCFKVKDGIR